MANDLVVKGNVKKAVPGMNVAGDVYAALNAQMQSMLKTAAERARSNGRKTIQAKDL